MATKKVVAVKNYIVMFDGDTFSTSYDRFTEAEAIKKAKSWAADGGTAYVMKLVGKAVYSDDDDSIPVL